MKFGFLAHYNFGLYNFRGSIIKTLCDMGHEVYAICPKGKYDNKIKKLGAKVINYDIGRRSINPFTELKTIFNIYKALKDLDLDVLHTFTAKPNIYGTLVAKMVKIPKVFNLIEGLGSLYVEKGYKNRCLRVFVEKLYKIVFKLSDGCVFVNTSDPRYYRIKKIIKKADAYVIQSVGVNTQIFNIQKLDYKKLESLKTQLELKDKKVVLMIARAIWHKGVKEFYECAKTIKEKRDDVEFILVGGADKGNPSCADEEFLSNGLVKWLGEQENVVDYLGICDIYVLPSYREGMSRSILEAASMSKPIVTTKVVGCKEIVEDNKNGFLVEPKNVHELNKYIEKLLDDKLLRQKMGEISRKKVLDNFEEKHIIRQYMNFYKKHNCI